MNSVFLYHATRAGLDLAIVNSEKIERFASLPPEARRLAEKYVGRGDPANDAAVDAFFANMPRDDFDRFVSRDQSSS